MVRLACAFLFLLGRRDGVGFFLPFFFLFFSPVRGVGPRIELLISCGPSENFPGMTPLFWWWRWKFFFFAGPSGSPWATSSFFSFEGGAPGGTFFSLLLFFFCRVVQGSHPGRPVAGAASALLLFFSPSFEMRVLFSFSFFFASSIPRYVAGCLRRWPRRPGTPSGARFIGGSALLFFFFFESRQGSPTKILRRSRRREGWPKPPLRRCCSSRVSFFFLAVPLSFFGGSVNYV